MDLATAIRGLVTGSTTPPPSSPAGLVAELRAAFGHRPPPGIPERTWRRARHQEGWKPAPPTLARLQAAVRRLRLPADRERQLRGAPVVVIKANITVSNDERNRKIIVTEWPQPPDIGALVDAYLADQLEAGADQFEHEMGANVDGPLYVGEVDRLEMFPTRAAAQRAMYDWR